MIAGAIDKQEDIVTEFLEHTLWKDKLKKGRDLTPKILSKVR